MSIIYMNFMYIYMHIYYIIYMITFGYFNFQLFVILANIKNELMISLSFFSAVNNYHFLFVILRFLNHIIISCLNVRCVKRGRGSEKAGEGERER